MASRIVRKSPRSYLTIVAALSLAVCAEETRTAPPRDLEEKSPPAVDPRATVKNPPRPRTPPVRIRPKEGFDPSAVAFDDLLEGSMRRTRTSTAIIRRNQLAGADLSKQLWTQYDLSGLILDGATLRLTKLNRAHLHRTSLRDTDARGAIFVDAQATRADFTNANLAAIKAQRANFAGAKFIGAQLQSANLYAANLSGADLSGARLEDAILISTRLGGARFDNATVLPFDRAHAELRGMIFQEK